MESGGRNTRCCRGAPGFVLLLALRQELLHLRERSVHEAGGRVDGIGFHQVDARSPEQLHRGLAGSAREERQVALPRLRVPGLDLLRQCDAAGTDRCGITVPAGGDSRG